MRVHGSGNGKAKNAREKPDESSGDRKGANGDQRSGRIDGNTAVYDSCDIARVSCGDIRV
jgi:hypothetical protein